MRHLTFAVLLSLLWLFVASCSNTPIPSELSLVASQEEMLRRDGASIYAPEEFISICKEHRDIKDRLFKEQARFAWFRNYELAQIEYRYLADRGQLLLQYVKDERARRNNSVTSSLASHEKKSAALLTLACSINEGRVARRSLTRAELLIDEARVLIEKERHKSALLLLNDAEYGF